MEEGRSKGGRERTKLGVYGPCRLQMPTKTIVCPELESAAAPLCAAPPPQDLPSAEACLPCSRLYLPRCCQRCLRCNRCYLLRWLSQRHEQRPRRLSILQWVRWPPRHRHPDNSPDARHSHPKKSLATKIYKTRERRKKTGKQQ